VVIADEVAKENQFNNMHKHKIVEIGWWKCWAWCVMWITNYFFDTAFWSKDADDLIILIRQKPFEHWAMFSETEMVNFLANLWLKIKLYYGEAWYYEKFAKDWIDTAFDWVEWLNSWISQKFAKKILNHKNIKIIYDKNISKNSFNIIKKNQSKNKIFILWWDYFELNQLKRWNDFWWHFFLSSWVEWNNFIIHDPWPPAKYNEKVDKNIVEKSMTYDKLVWLLIEVEYEWKVNYI